MIIRWIRVAISLFLLTLPLTTSAQGKAGSASDNQTKKLELKSGQVWKTASGETVIILKIEDLPKIGRVIHVRFRYSFLTCCG